MVKIKEGDLTEEEKVYCILKFLEECHESGQALIKYINSKEDDPTITLSNVHEELGHVQAFLEVLKWNIFDGDKVNKESSKRITRIYQKLNKNGKNIQN